MDRPVYTCTKCGKTFTRKSSLARHQSKKDVACKFCGKTFRQDNLERHLGTCKTKLTVTQRQHNLEEEREEEEYTNEYQSDLLKDDPFDASDSIFIYPEDIRGLVTENWYQIRTHSHESQRIQNRYCIRLSNEIQLSDMAAVMAAIHKRQRYSYKVNVCFGFILQDTITQQLVFNYASRNTNILTKPATITNNQDLQNLSRQLQATDIHDYCFRQRPNTKYVVRRITNALFYINKLIPFRIECPANIRDYVKKLRSCLFRCFDTHRKQLTDNHCFFRCLCYHLHGKANKNKVDELLAQWMDGGAANFRGVAWDEIDQLEDFLGVNIEVYQIEEDETGYFSQNIRTSLSKYANTMNLHLEGTHFCYIKKLQTYSKRWKCEKCSKLFNQKHDHSRHERTCTGLTKYEYPGGGFGMPLDVFDQLEELEMSVDWQDRFYPYRAAYDFEALFDCHGCDGKTGALARLQPASVSVCSNVPGYTEPHCFVANDTNGQIVKDMLTYLLEMSYRASEIMHNKFKWVTEQLEELVKDEEEGDDDDDEESAYRSESSKVKERFEKWLNQLVVLGFNSGKFDLNLVREFFFPTLLEIDESITSFIKRGNDYICIHTESLLFLDIKNYIAPTTSYDRWLQSNDVAVRKGFFPYEWLTSLEKLDQTQLVPHEQFFSRLRNKNISEEEYDLVRKTWEENNFQNMRALLTWYNNFDVEPFIEAAERMFERWKKLDIDPFKGPGISLPGLSMAHLMKTMPSHVVLPLFPDKHKHLHTMLHANITGGLCIVCHRYHEKGVTHLPDGSVCEVIYSHDANGLYLYSLAQPTGTGVYIYWTTSANGKDAVGLRNEPDSQQKWTDAVSQNMETIFSHEPTYTYYKEELEWLEWMTFQTKEKIRHRFNGGQKIIRYDKRSKFPVDGYIQRTKTVLQYHGCRYHGHGCKLDDKKSHEAKARTQRVTESLVAAGFKVIEMWECEWIQIKKNSPAITEFLRREVWINHVPSKMTAREMLSLVENDQFFGLIECDIEVPKWSKRLMEYFAGFPPICKNIEVSRDDIGEHMSEYAKEHGMLSTPRRALISSYFGKKILLATPLIRWYVAKGLEVSRVYSAIQMKPKACFAHLSDEVADHRRIADRDPQFKADGEQWKLIGNNYYGKCCTDKTKHKDWSICSSDHAAGQYVNNPRFHELNELNEGTYEVSMDKKKIVFDLPITVAYFVYNYAKLRVLSFTYDFLKKFMRKGSYQIVCSDTDSIIAGYASRNIDELVVPHLKDEYAKAKPEYLVSNDDNGYSLRTPGLFKIELEANGIIATCPKTYIAWGDNDEVKVSCKGLSKKTNNFTKEDFMKVLRTGIRGGGKNTGFKRFGNALYQYEQSRDGLSYLYIKRRVLEDGISTEPLDL